jgi:ubiquinone/menaquinone biosynthesis C-methylase UbiE
MSKIRKINKKFIWGGVHPFSYHVFVSHFIPDLRGKIAVDCGCGKGIWGYLIRTIRDIGDGGKLIGIDINSDYLKFCRFHRVYNKLLNQDIRKFPFKDKSIDFVICSEVIEHLTQKQGNLFLKEIDRVMAGGGRVIITTPNVHIETIIKSGPDAHHSIWSAKEFQEKGYKVVGFGIKIPSGFGKWYTPLLLGLGLAFTPISYYIPSIGGYLIAIKDY